MKILGIDPSLLKTGWGIIEITPKGVPQHLEHGVISTKQKWAAEIRLNFLQEEIEKILAIHQPDILCIEATYCGINPVTTLKLGFAYGAILAAAGRVKLPVLSYATRTVKQLVTGKGSNGKEEVRTEVESFFNVKVDKIDASDALAVALAHYKTTANNV